VGHRRLYRPANRHADALKPQDGLYTLITRSGEGDTFELIGALSAVHGATEHETYLDYLSRAELAIITITVTVTEAGYLRGADGHLDAGRDVIVSDLESLAVRPWEPCASLPARLVAGLVARRSAGRSSAHHPVLQQPARERCRHKDGGPRFRRPVGRDAGRLD
jgi:mannitol-1-phosphate/altronate dehydrogenase